MSFSASGLPSGLTVSTSAGIISGVPASSGSFNVTLSATNGAGTGTATLALTVTNLSAGIAAALDAPGRQFTVSGNAQWFPQANTTRDGVEALESGDISRSQSTVLETAVTGPATGNPVSFEASGLPPGLTVNTENGIISGTPATPGLYNATVTATNGFGPGSGSVAITVLSGAEIGVFGGDPAVAEILSGDVSPSTFDGTEFRAVFVGSSLDRIFRVANEGIRTLEISGITASPPFSLPSGFPASVAAGSSAEFTVRFAPDNAVVSGMMSLITSPPPARNFKISARN